MLKSVQSIIAEAQTEINCITAEQAKTLLMENEGTVIIDLRDEASAQASQLNAAVNIPRGILEMKIQQVCPEASMTILLHCAAGGRASLAAKTLQDMGYTNVHAITEKFSVIKAEIDG